MTWVGSVATDSLYNPPHMKAKLQGLSKKAVDQVLVFQKNEEIAAMAPPREKGINVAK
jgi:hypothetical protein